MINSQTSQASPSTPSQLTNQPSHSILLPCVVLLSLCHPAHKLFPLPIGGAQTNWFFLTGSQSDFVAQQCRMQMEPED